MCIAYWSFMDLENAFNKDGRAAMQNGAPVV